MVKSKTMAGFDAPYVPGWDCHGLPIEIKVDQMLGGKKLQMRPLDVRQECRKFAQKFLDLQREQFKRIGVFGRFERPYATMNPQYESVVLKTFFSPDPSSELSYCIRAPLRRASAPGKQMAELLLLRAQVAMLPGSRRHLDRHALDDADAVRLETLDLLGVVGHEADLAQAQVAEDLAADAVVAPVLREGPSSSVGLDGVQALFLQGVGVELVRQADAAAFLVQVDEHAPAARRRSCCMAAASWSPQSQRSEPKTSPVRHCDAGARARGRAPARCP